MQAIKKYLGEILTTIGVTISTYNILNFSYETTYGIAALPKLGEKPIEGVAYYYSNESAFFITVGFTLITVGILIIKNRK